MVSLPSHSDVGTLLKAKDSSFLSFFSGFQPPKIAVHCTVVYVGIVILVVKTEKKATCLMFFFRYQVVDLTCPGVKNF